jgi:TPR repeat protein
MTATTTPPCWPSGSRSRQGQPRAQARLHEDGQGVPRDAAQALVWYRKAHEVTTTDERGLRLALRLEREQRHAANPGLRDGAKVAPSPCAP